MNPFRIFPSACQRRIGLVIFVAGLAPLLGGCAYYSELNFIDKPARSKLDCDTCRPPEPIYRTPCGKPYNPYGGGPRPYCESSNYSSRYGRGGAESKWDKLGERG